MDDLGFTNWTAHYLYVAANVGGEDMPPLLYTCDDPMYPGPMHKIAYTYRTTVNYAAMPRSMGRSAAKIILMAQRWSCRKHADRSQRHDAY